MDYTARREYVEVLDKVRQAVPKRPEPGSPPAMSAGGYICIEKLADHWYRYKTT